MPVFFLKYVDYRLLIMGSSLTKPCFQCAEDISRWAIFHVRGLPTYIDDRVALLGDAVSFSIMYGGFPSLFCSSIPRHMQWQLISAPAQDKQLRYCSPFINNVSLLILVSKDAFILGRLLSDRRVTSKNVNTALQVYDTIRRPFGNGIVERVRAAGLLYEFNGMPSNIREEGIRSGDMQELRKLGESIYQKWEIQWTELPDEGWRDAERLLNEKLTVIQSRL